MVSFEIFGSRIFRKCHVIRTILASIEDLKGCQTILMVLSCKLFSAVEVRSGPDGFMVKMRDGRHLRCVHNNPQSGHLPDYVPHPAIVLKMEDGTGLLLPIIVCKCFIILIILQDC